jgi:hypothetical protein
MRQRGPPQAPARLPTRPPTHLLIRLPAHPRERPRALTHPAHPPLQAAEVTSLGTAGSRVAGVAAST